MQGVVYFLNDITEDFIPDNKKLLEDDGKLMEAKEILRDYTAKMGTLMHVSNKV